jgi:hypothetical protein
MRPVRSSIAVFVLYALLAWQGRLTLQASDPLLRPFADYEDTGFVFMSAFDAFGADDLKRAIAARLPPDVTLILYGYSNAPGERQKVLADYGRFVPAERLRYIAFQRARNMFWSRDAMPVPLLDETGALSLTDAKYFGGFEPDAAVAALFGARLTSHSFTPQPSSVTRTITLTRSPGAGSRRFACRGPGRATKPTSTCSSSTARRSCRSSVALKTPSRWTCTGAWASRWLAWPRSPSRRRAADSCTASR